MAGLNNLISDTTTKSTTLPTWMDQAQQNVVNMATTGAGQVPQLQNTVAGRAINTYGGESNPFSQAQNTLSSIASGAANPWIVTPQYSQQQQSPYGALRTAQTQPSSEFSPFAAIQPGDDFGGGRAGTMSARMDDGFGGNMGMDQHGSGMDTGFGGINGVMDQQPSQMGGLGGLGQALPGAAGAKPFGPPSMNANLQPPDTSQQAYNQFMATANFGANGAGAPSYDEWKNQTADQYQQLSNMRAQYGNNLPTDMGVQQGQPTGYNVAPNPNTALGGLFAAQNQQLKQIMPQFTAPVDAASIGSGNFGSLRGETAYNKAIGDAQANLFAQQNQAALQNQQTGVNAATGMGNIGAQDIAGAGTLTNLQQTAPLSAAANVSKIIGGLSAPTSVTSSTQLSPLSQIGSLTSALGGGTNAVNSLLNTIKPGTDIASLLSGLFDSKSTAGGDAENQDGGFYGTADGTSPANPYANLSDEQIQYAIDNNYGANLTQDQIRGLQNMFPDN